MRSALLILLTFTFALVHGAEASTFANPIAEGADPWVVRHGDHYYWCSSGTNRSIVISRSDRLTSLGEKHVVWRAPATGPHSREVWAPELHHLDGHWYVYVGASDGKNANHRTIVLESATDDPLSAYAFKAELYTGDHLDTKADNRWAIDATILEHKGRRYVIWSGWEDTRDEQWLYIATLANPWTVSSNRVRLAANGDFLWERVDEKLTGRGLAEAPEVLTRNGRVFVTYSCSGSWQPSYKLGMLTLAPDGDPMNPAAWTKGPQPVFQSDEKTFGVGHNCFVTSPDGREDWLVYHSKVNRSNGWQRTLRLQPFRWNADGTPNFGSPVPAGTLLPVPSGQRNLTRTGGDFREEFRSGLAAWDYYGHVQYCIVAPGEVQLGRPDGELVNAFRSGEKLILRDRTWADARFATRLRVTPGGKPAGLLFRAAQPAVGRQAQRAYFAAIAADPARVVLSYLDGSTTTELASAPLTLDAAQPHTLEVTALGDKLTVTVDGKPALTATDAHLTTGLAGLRIDDGAAVFESFSVAPLAR
ncbi:MAG: family 43 glycosylhydrolase [Verrucomicrobia bacterium]|nr:family 43 glycosylhydrolase [Verrucomicrobiota bacterium]